MFFMVGWLVGWWCEHHVRVLLLLIGYEQCCDEVLPQPEMHAALRVRAGWLAPFSELRLPAVEHGATAGLAGVAVHAQAFEHRRGFVLAVRAIHGPG